MGPGLVFILIVLLLVLVVAPWRVFRSGMRSRFIAEMPFGHGATFIALITGGGLFTDYQRGALSLERLPYYLAIVFALAIVGLTLWFAGFFFGRRKRAKQSGILTRR